MHERLRVWHLVIPADLQATLRRWLLDGASTSFLLLSSHTTVGSWPQVGTLIEGAPEATEAGSKYPVDIECAHVCS